MRFLIGRTALRSTSFKSTSSSVSPSVDDLAHSVQSLDAAARSLEDQISLVHTRVEAPRLMNEVIASSQCRATRLTIRTPEVMCESLPEFAAFCRHELPIRLARRSVALHTLPAGVAHSDLVRTLQINYIRFFREATNVGPISASHESLVSFIRTITERQQVIPNAPRGISRVVAEFRDSFLRRSIAPYGTCDLSFEAFFELHAKLDEILGDFFRERLACRFLVAQMRERFAAENLQKSNTVLSPGSSEWNGILCRSASPAALAKWAIKVAQMRCRLVYGFAPTVACEMMIPGSDDTPSEIISQEMRASELPAMEMRPDGTLKPMSLSSLTPTFRVPRFELEQVCRPPEPGKTNGTIQCIPSYIVSVLMELVCNALCASIQRTNPHLRPAPARFSFNLRNRHGTLVHSPRENDKKASNPPPAWAMWPSLLRTGRPAAIVPPSGIPVRVSVSMPSQDSEETVFRVRDFGEGVPRRLVPFLQSHLFSTGQTAYPRQEHSVMSPEEVRDIMEVARRPKENEPWYHCEDLDPALCGAELISGTSNSTGTAASYPTVGGTGIGLPLCKHYLDFCGGEMEIVPVEGRGMDIYVRVPTKGF